MEKKIIDLKQITKPKIFFGSKKPPKDLDLHKKPSFTVLERYGSNIGCQKRECQVKIYTTFLSWILGKIEAQLQRIQGSRDLYTS